MDSEHQSIITCQCLGSASSHDESKDGPLYSHLGAYPSVASLRESLIQQLQMQHDELRIEKLRYTTKEGISTEGCPAAKWIIRRSSEKEQVLVIVKERNGHSCRQSVIVIAFVRWSAVPTSIADPLYEYLKAELPQNGIITDRRCGTNETRTCACQGFDDSRCGASYSFGCSWSMFHNACKFARTKENAKTFKLRNSEHEPEIAMKLNYLADVVGQVYSEISPTAYENQTRLSELAKDCRLGQGDCRKRAFSGLTVCMDFATHSHKDSHNMEGGSTVVCTLTRPQHYPNHNEDEQLHVLTNYYPANEDEFGSKEGQQQKYVNKSIEQLEKFSKITRVRAIPLDSCTMRKKKKQSANSKPVVKEENSPASIDSGFESIKSNHSPDKFDDMIHSNNMSPQIQGSPTNNNVLPPISSWFRKGSVEWIPPHPQQMQSTPRPMSHHVVRKEDGHEMSYSPHCPPQNGYYYHNYATPPQPGYYNRDMYATRPYYEQSYSGGYPRMYSQYPMHRSTPYYPHHPQQRCEYPYPYAHPQYRYPSHHQYYNHQVQYSHPPAQNYYRPVSYPPMQDHPLQRMPMPNADNMDQMMNSQSPVAKNKPLKRSVQEEKRDQEYLSENVELFKDSTIGGVAIALTHGSVLIEAAKKEQHATTALKYPNRWNPTRISLVFYQHKNMCYAHHGYNEYAHKMKLLRQKRAEEAAAESQNGSATPKMEAQDDNSASQPFPMYTESSEAPSLNFLEKLTADFV